MKKIVFAILCMMPFTTMAQDNTWERIEIEETDETKVNPDLKYLEGAVPLVNGKVEFSTVIKAPGKNKEQIYDITKKYLTKMTTEPNQTEFSRVVIDNPEKGELCGAFQEWLVFKSTSLSLDRTRFFFNLVAECKNGELELRMIRIHYLYEEERDPQTYKAEEWITDEYALNKKKDKLLRISGKFRRKTIDRKDFIFNKFDNLLNNNK